jgi:hypothetical protein
MQCYLKGLKYSRRLDDISTLGYENITMSRNVSNKLSCDVASYPIRTHTSSPPLQNLKLHKTSVLYFVGREFLRLVLQDNSFA